MTLSLTLAVFSWSFTLSNYFLSNSLALGFTGSLVPSFVVTVSNFPVSNFDISIWMMPHAALRPAIPRILMAAFQHSPKSSALAWRTKALFPILNFLFYTFFHELTNDKAACLSYKYKNNKLKSRVANRPHIENAKFYIKKCQFDHFEEGKNMPNSIFKASKSQNKPNFFNRIIFCWPHWTKLQNARSFTNS